MNILIICHNHAFALDRLWSAFLAFFYGIISGSRGASRAYLK